MMKYNIASTLDEIFEAWCIVYKQYLKNNLITPNPFSLFTFPEYISSNSAVVVGKKMNVPVCTVSAVLDSEKGLPLDRYYQRELDKLRGEGKNLVEIGLLADQRKSTNANDITDLMAAIAKFGVYSDHYHYVIGVNPRRINFFKSLFNFEKFGTVKDYSNLKSAPVILLYANAQDLNTISLKANSAIFDTDPDLKFYERYKFNSQNFIFGNKLETFLQNIWSVPSFGRV